MPKYTKSKEKPVPGFTQKYMASDRTMPSFKKKFKESSKIVFHDVNDEILPGTRHHSEKAQKRYTKAVPRKPRSRPAWERKNLAFETSKQ